MAKPLKWEGRMRVTLMTAAALATILSIAARADDYPPRKAGLWEVAVHNPAVPDVTMKLCIDPDTDQMFHKFSGDVRAKHCQKNTVNVSGTTVTAESVCLLGSITTTTDAVTTFTGDSAYHVDIKMHFDPPKLGQSDVAITQDAKWTGDCPADMKPGDMDMGHGLKFNIKTVNMLKSLFHHDSSQ
jgi:hypothetical protein